MKTGIQKTDHVLYRDPQKTYPVVDRAEGIYLFDKKGKRFIDGSGGAMVVTIGHGVGEILDAMVEQAKKVSYAYTNQFTNEPQIQLAEKVTSMAPADISRAYFVSSGSGATETALKITRQYHLSVGKPSKYKVVSRWQSFHGNTIGALSMTGRPSWRRDYLPYIIDFPHIPPPYCFRCPFGKEYPHCDLDCAYELERVIKWESAETVAAFISEPLSGTSMTAVTPPLEYYKVIREICDKYDVLMIVDEVITGFGRTGKNFGIEHWDVVPDVITTGKGISSGYAPLAAVLIHEKVYERLRKRSLGSAAVFTYAGHPLSCAIALAVQDYMAEHNLIENVVRMGSYLEDQLTRLKEMPIVGDIRGKGLMMGIEFVADKQKKTPFEVDKAVTRNIVSKAFEKGLIILAGTPGLIDGVLGDHMMIGPPYIVTESDIDEMCNILKESIREIQRELNYE
jgi:adenosylmethionine-8-amino-7-oxononanoate aminotransferase